MLQEHFFQFATRYEINLANFYTSANDSTCQAKICLMVQLDEHLQIHFLDILVKIHTDDPVSAKEIDYQFVTYNTII